MESIKFNRENEVEVMRKLGRERIEFGREKEKRKIMMLNRNILITLMAKEHLSPVDEEMKCYLMRIVFI
ncbi:hypothetical protein ACS0TY_006813 [Phlomoides rotata]